MILFFYLDDVLVRMMDDRTAEPVKTLFGHVGPVYGCAFSPDRNLLLTCGHDGSSKFKYGSFITNLFFLNIEYTTNYLS